VISHLLNVPKSKAAWDEWSLHHKLSHDLIRQAIQKKTGINLAQYQLDPIDLERPTQFLQNNAQSHIEMTTPVGVQSSDLQDVNLGDDRQLVSWIYIHWQEHNMVELALGL